MLRLTAFRLTEEDLALVAALAKKLGVTGAGVVRMAIRRFAEAEGVQATPKRARKPRAKPE